MSFDVKSFESDVLQVSQEVPVVVDFWAEWCGPCRILGPILEKLAGEEGARWRLAKVDVDAFPEVAGRYGVRGIPSVQLFIDGAPVDGFVGALPEAGVRRWLDRVVPDESERAVRKVIGEARELVAAGRPDEARVSLDRLIAKRPDHQEARLELAKILVFSEPARVRELLDRLDILGRGGEVADSLVRFVELFERLDEPGALAGTPAGIRYLEAIRRLRAQDFEGALEGFIATLRENRDLDGDGPRQACVAIFRYLGPGHPLVIRFRGELSGALYR